MRIFLILLLAYSGSVVAKDSMVELPTATYQQLHQLFLDQHVITINGILDLADKEEKVSQCVSEYIKIQSKSYARIAQNNLYDLIHNFNRSLSKIYGKKLPADNIPYSEKIEALAKLQCDAYYTMGVLK